VYPGGVEVSPYSDALQLSVVFSGAALARKPDL